MHARGASHAGDQVNPQRITTNANDAGAGASPRQQTLSRKNVDTQRRLAFGREARVAGLPLGGRGHTALGQRQATLLPLPSPYSRRPRAGCSRVFFNRLLGATVCCRSLDKFPTRKACTINGTAPVYDARYSRVILHPRWIENILLWTEPLIIYFDEAHSIVAYHKRRVYAARRRRRALFVLLVHNMPLFSVTNTNILLLFAKLPCRKPD